MSAKQSVLYLTTSVDKRIWAFSIWIFSYFFFCWSPDWLNLTYDAKESMSIIYSAEPSLLTNWLVLFSIHGWSLITAKFLEATGKENNWKQSLSHYEQLFATLTAKLTNELIFSVTIYECWGYSIWIKTVDSGSCQNSPGQTSNRFVVTWQTISEHLHKQLCLDSRTTNHLLIIFSTLRTFSFQFGLFPMGKDSGGEFL